MSLRSMLNTFFGGVDLEEAAASAQAIGAEHAQVLAGGYVAGFREEFERILTAERRDIIEGEIVAAPAKKLPSPKGKKGR